ASPTRSAHPLDPLRPDEIERAAQIVRDAVGVGPSVRFVSMSTAEPPRDATAPAPRAAEVILHDRARRLTFELVVDLDRGEIVARNERTGVEPAMTVEEFEFVEQAVRRDPRFVEALRRRGIDDPSTVDIDPASAGVY